MNPTGDPWVNWYMPLMENIFESASSWLTDILRSTHTISLFFIMFLVALLFRHFLRPLLGGPLYFGSDTSKQKGVSRNPRDYKPVKMRTSDGDRARRR